MGMIVGGFISELGRPAGGGPTVTLTNDLFNTVSDGVSPYSTRLGIRINSDGTVDRYEGTDGSYSYTQINASTDWIIPNGDADSSYDVRITITSGTPNFSSDNTGQWLNLGSNRQWILERTASGTGSVNWLIEIRKDGGAVIDSMQFTGTLENGV